MAVRSISGLRDTTKDHDLEIVAAVDHDPETAETIKPLVDILLYSDSYRGCSRAWNDALAASTGDPVVFAADDLIWQEGWLDAALAALEENPGCMIGFNDGHWGSELSTHYLMPREFITQVLGGRVAWEGYKHSFNDLETCDRARRAGRYRWCEQALVYHEHWLFGDRAQDDTDTRRLPDHPEDERIYRQRQAAGFPDDLEPVITC